MTAIAPTAPGRQQLYAMAAVAAGATLFGTTGTAKALGPDGLNAIWVGLWRSIIGGALLVLASAVVDRPPWASPFRPRPTALGAVAVAVYPPAFFTGVEGLGVTRGTVAAIGTGLAAAGVIDVIRYRRPPTTLWVLGVTAALSGIVLMSGSGGQPATAVGWIGAVVSGCSYPLYGLAAQRLMDDRPPLAAIATVFGAGAAISLPLGLLAPPGGDVDAGAVALVVYLGAATLGLAYWLWGLGLHRLPLSATVTLTLWEPAAATLLAAALLDEELAAVQWVGVGLVGCGVVVATLANVGSNPAGPVAVGGARRADRGRSEGSSATMG